MIRIVSPWVRFSNFFRSSPKTLVLIWPEPSSTVIEANFFSPSDWYLSVIFAIRFTLTSLLVPSSMWRSFGFVVSADWSKIWFPFNRSPTRIL